MQAVTVAWRSTTSFSRCAELKLEYYDHPESEKNCYSSFFITIHAIEAAVCSGRVQNSKKRTCILSSYFLRQAWSIDAFRGDWQAAAQWCLGILWWMFMISNNAVAQTEHPSKFFILKATRRITELVKISRKACEKSQNLHLTSLVFGVSLILLFFTFSGCSTESTVKILFSCLVSGYINISLSSFLISIGRASSSMSEEAFSTPLFRSLLTGSNTDRFGT